MSLEVRLRVFFAVVACFDDGNFIVSLVVLCVDASSAIECDELIGGTSGLKLDDDGVLVWIVFIISNTKDFARPNTLGLIEHFRRTAVPSELPALVEKEWVKSFKKQAKETTTSITKGPTSSILVISTLSKQKDEVHAAEEENLPWRH